MERRTLLERFFSVITFGSLALLASCGKSEMPAGFGNQEKLWHLVIGQDKVEEPIDPSYVKDTPAFYRDASMGKVDPNFVPKISGG